MSTFSTKVKIFYDGSHYIGIPYLHDPDIESKDTMSFLQATDKDKKSSNEKNEAKTPQVGDIEEPQGTLDIFEMYYKEAMALPKSQRFDFYYNYLSDLIPDREQCNRFVQTQLNRKFKNFIYRKLRMIRKINLIRFDYFCTFTYDGSKLNEEEFRKKLGFFLSHKATRDNWKYIGVWERSPEKNRLHFHCLLKADRETIPGDFIKKRIWSSKVKRMRSVLENVYLRERFGVNDFSSIDYEDGEEYNDCISYLLKYIEKSGERIVYSRGLYQFFVANIDTDNDVLSVRHSPGIRLVLYDDFKAYNEDGELVGTCSKETLQKLKKTNV